MTTGTAFTFAQQRVPLAVGKTTVDVIADLGQSMVIALANPDLLREQDENARVMEGEMFNQLVVNLKRRGLPESLPYCVATERGVEIVSGHHRVRAARAAGMTEVPIILDRSGLTRSQIVAKQLAHNNLAGFDDKDVLRRRVAHISEVDDLLEAYLPKDLNVEPAPVDLDKLLAPRVTFDWKILTFTFLPHQFEQVKALSEALVGAHDLVGLALIEQFQPLIPALGKYSRFKNVTAVGMIVAVLIQQALQAISEGGTLAELVREDGKPLRTGWVELEALLGTARVPSDVAVVIQRALEAMLAAKVITRKNLWQALELWAADYLATSKSGEVA